MSNSPEAIREYIASEYKTTSLLIQAFVNDGITQGHALNLEVYGNTLYLNGGNDGKNLYFHQIAIRISEDVFVINSRAKVTGQSAYPIYREELWDASAVRIMTVRRYMDLPTLQHKNKQGRIHSEDLRTEIEQSYTGRVKTALKKYGRDRMQEGAVKCFDRLQINADRLENHGRIKDNIIIKAIIKQSAKDAKRARKVCAMLDKYLDILKQLPEKPSK